MPEITSILTDDIGTITHLVTLEGERLTMDELAQRLDVGDDYYVTFGEEQRFSITMVAEDGRLEPTVDDTDGVHTIWDLPTEADPEEAEIENMFDEMNRMGEYDKEVDDPYVDDDDTNPESLL
jgi:hypothetical protein